MAMALAVAMVACQAATPKPGAKGDPGDPGAQGPKGDPGTSDNAVPMAVMPMPMLYVALGGSGLTPDKTAEPIDLGKYFKDNETPTLAYKVKSVEPKDVATVTIADGKTKTVGKKAGTATVTIEVYDGVNDPVEGTFSVMVVASNVKPVVAVLSIGTDSDVAKLGKKLYVDRGASTVTVTSIIYDYGATEGSAEDELKFDAKVGNTDTKDDDVVTVSVMKGSKPDTWDVTLTPKKAGQQNVEVMVKDKFGAMATNMWKFVVLVNTKPSVAIPLPDRTVTVGATAVNIQTAAHFKVTETDPTQPMVLNSADPSVMEASASWAATVDNTAGSVAHPDHIPDATGGTGDVADSVDDNASRAVDVTCSYSTSPDHGSGSIAATSDTDMTPVDLPIPQAKAGQYKLTIACRDAEDTAVSTATITVLPDPS